MIIKSRGLSLVGLEISEIYLTLRLKGQWNALRICIVNAFILKGLNKVIINSFIPNEWWYTLSTCLFESKICLQSRTRGLYFMFFLTCFIK